MLKGERADYGQQVLEGLAQQITAEFGRGWSKRNLAHMVKFVEAFPDENIVNALRTQLSWTHFRTLIAIDMPLKREFYTAMALQEHWSTRCLNERVDSQLFERTALSKKTGRNDHPRSFLTQSLRRSESELNP